MKPPEPPVRPVWLVFIAIVIGIIAVAGIIALASFHFFYLFLIFPILMAVAGGIFAWLWADRLGFATTWRSAVLGVAFGLVIYGLYRYFEYLFFHGTLPEGTVISFWEFTTAVAEEGLVFSRRYNQAGIVLTEFFVWIAWALEIAGIAVVSGWIGRDMKI